jgi:hypothetical protein
MSSTAEKTSSEKSMAGVTAESDKCRCKPFHIGVLVVACLFIGYLYVSSKPSGFIGNFVPWVSGSDVMPDDMPSLVAMRRCTKCKYTLTGKMCPRCGSCPNCRAEHRCGECQFFPRQIALGEMKSPCAGCGKRPCGCPNALGKSVEKEPGVSRNGVFSDIVSTSF